MCCWTGPKYLPCSPNRTNKWGWSLAKYRPTPSHESIVSEELEGCWQSQKWSQWLCSALVSTTFCSVCPAYNRPSPVAVSIHFVEAVCWNPPCQGPSQSLQYCLQAEGRRILEDTCWDQQHDWHFSVSGYIHLGSGERFSAKVFSVEKAFSWKSFSLKAVWNFQLLQVSLIPLFTQDTNTHFFPQV